MISGLMLSLKLLLHKGPKKKSKMNFKVVIIVSEQQTKMQTELSQRENFQDLVQQPSRMSILNILETVQTYNTLFMANRILK